MRESLCIQMCQLSWVCVAVVHSTICMIHGIEYTGIGKSAFSTCHLCEVKLLWNDAWYPPHKAAETKDDVDHVVLTFCRSSNETEQQSTHSQQTETTSVTGHLHAHSFGKLYDDFYLFIHSSDKGQCNLPTTSTESPQSWMKHEKVDTIQ